MTEKPNKKENYQKQEKTNSKNEYKATNCSQKRSDNTKINTTERCASPSGTKGNRPSNKK